MKWGDALWMRKNLEKCDVQSCDNYIVIMSGIMRDEARRVWHARVVYLVSCPERTQQIFIFLFICFVALYSVRMRQRNMWGWCRKWMTTAGQGVCSWSEWWVKDGLWAPSCLWWVYWIKDVWNRTVLRDRYMNILIEMIFLLLLFLARIWMTKWRASVLRDPLRKNNKESRMLSATVYISF